MFDIKSINGESNADNDDTKSVWSSSSRASISNLLNDNDEIFGEFVWSSGHKLHDVRQKAINGEKKFGGLSGAFMNTWETGGRKYTSDDDDNQSENYSDYSEDNDSDY